VCCDKLWTLAGEFSGRGFYVLLPVAICSGTKGVNMRRKGERFNFTKLIGHEVVYFTFGCRTVHAIVGNSPTSGKVDLIYYTKEGRSVIQAHNVSMGLRTGCFVIMNECPVDTSEHIFWKDGLFIGTPKTEFERQHMWDWGFNT
jgi:hypothetical protein